MFLDNREGNVVAVATQSAAVRFVTPFLSLSKLGNSALRNLGFNGNAGLVTVAASTSVLEAMGILTDLQVTGIPVLDEIGHIVANLRSEREQRLLRLTLLPSLAACATFLVCVCPTFCT